MSIKRTTDITSIEIGNKTVKNSYEIASEFNKLSSKHQLVL